MRDPGQVDLGLVPGNMARTECGGGDDRLGFWLSGGQGTPRGWDLSFASLKPFARGVWHLTVTEQRGDGVRMLGRKD